jgi:ribosomal protein L37AE/L43A
MVKRTCPNCGTDNYSAWAEGDWDCCECGGKIPKESEQDGVADA